jgi:hypothetical protein
VQDAGIRDAVLTLIAMGRMPTEDVGDDTCWEPWERAVRALINPATDEEAAAVLDVLPRGENSAYALAWHLLHVVESAPGWPESTVLDDRSPWVVFLRERAERGHA